MSWSVLCEVTQVLQHTTKHLLLLLMLLLLLELLLLFLRQIVHHLVVPRHWVKHILVLVLHVEIRILRLLLLHRLIIVELGNATTSPHQNFANLLSVQLAPVADLPEWKVQVFAVEAHPVSRPLHQGFLHTRVSPSSSNCCWWLGRLVIKLGVQV